MLAQEHLLDVASVCGHSLYPDFDVVQLDDEISQNIATQPPPDKEEIISDRSCWELIITTTSHGTSRFVSE